jgi:hypothetical protein
VSWAMEQATFALTIMPGGAAACRRHTHPVRRRFLAEPGACRPPLTARRAASTGKTFMLEAIMRLLSVVTCALILVAFWRLDSLRIRGQQESHTRR